MKSNSENIIAWLKQNREFWCYPISILVEKAKEEGVYSKRNAATELGKLIKMIRDSGEPSSLPKS